MATNGISSGGLPPQTAAALGDAIRAQGAGDFAKVDGQSKNRAAYGNRFDTPVHGEAQVGRGALAQRHISVGPGTDSARARTAQGAGTLASGLGAFMNGTKTLARPLQNHVFSASAKASRPPAAGNLPKQERAAAADRQGPALPGTGSPGKSSVASRNHRPDGLNQKLANIEKRAKDQQGSW